MLGTFTYSHNDGSTVTCAANSLLNVCDAWTTMKFDYTKCFTVQGFSSMFSEYAIAENILTMIKNSNDITIITSPSYPR